MTEIQIIENGPMIVKGTMEITHADGTKETKENRASFCRCGASSNQPYCDGTHRKLNAEKENG